MRRRLGLFLSLAGTGFILSLSLWPSPASLGEEIRFWCLFCHERDLADAFLNLLFYIPLGAGLSLLCGPWFAVVGSLCLSGLAELSQTWLPGRFPAAADLIFNTVGGAIGAALVFRGRNFLKIAQAPPRSLITLSVVLPHLVFLATAILSSQSLPSSVYHGQWARELGRYRAYPGKILEASVNGISLPDGRLSDPYSVRRALLSGQQFRLVLEAAQTSAEPHHLFAIYDDRSEEILILWTQGGDLFFQRRTRSVDLLLDHPFFRLPGVMRIPEGEILHVAFTQKTRNLCVTVEAHTWCDVASGVEGGWRLFYRAEGAPGWVVMGVSAIWLLLAAVPAGFFLRSERRGGLVGLAISLVGALISWLTPWLSFHPWTLVPPALGGWIGGRINGVIVRRWYSPDG